MLQETETNEASERARGKERRAVKQIGGVGGGKKSTRMGEERGSKGHRVRVGSNRGNPNLSPLSLSHLLFFF